MKTQTKKFEFTGLKYPTRKPTSCQASAGGPLGEATACGKTPATLSQTAFGRMVLCEQHACSLDILTKLTLSQE
jgi:hypothetical protein